MNLGWLGLYMVKKLSDLVNTALNKCSLSLGNETDQPTCKTNIIKATRGPTKFFKL